MSQALGAFRVFYEFYLERAGGHCFCSRVFLRQFLEGSLVKWFTDSQAAARIIEVGSMKLDLHRLAIKIFSVFARSTVFVWRCSGSHVLKMRGRTTSVGL